MKASFRAAGLIIATVTAMGLSANMANAESMPTTIVDAKGCSLIVGDAAGVGSFDLTWLNVRHFRSVRMQTSLPTENAVPRWRYDVTYPDGETITLTIFNDGNANNYRQKVGKVASVIESCK